MGAMGMGGMGGMGKGMGKMGMGMGVQGMGMMGKGGARPQMPARPMGMQQPPQQMAAARPQAAAARPFDPNGPLTAAALAAAPPGMQKQMLGEKLFPAISRMHPEMGGKITGMMLEMDNSELLILLESPDQLKARSTRRSASSRA